MDCEYIKDYYRQLVVDLSRQKELDADPKTIQHVELVGQLKNATNVIDDDDDESVCFNNFRKNQRNEIKIIDLADLNADLWLKIFCPK